MQRKSCRVRETVKDKTLANQGATGMDSGADSKEVTGTSPWAKTHRALHCPFGDLQAKDTEVTLLIVITEVCNKYRDTNFPSPLHAELLSSAG